MSLFTGHLEIALLDNLNRELIRDIAGQYISYYAVDIRNSNTNNLYGESLQKTFKKPTKIYALVEYGDPSTTTTLEGVDTSYTAEIGFLRSMLADVNIYPREGDYIQFEGDSSKEDSLYFEITSVLEEKLIEGKFANRWDIHCSCRPVRVDIMNIIDMN